MTNETCFAKDNLDAGICSGHGTCVCGACVCENTAQGKYSGQFCEKCPVSTIIFIYEVIIDYL